jgi:uncharacterized protein YuzE
MKLKIDQVADALYLALADADIVESEEVAPGVIVDYDADQRIVGIELLHLSKRAPDLDVGRLLYETVPVLPSQ